MFVINEDNSIYVTRGDIVAFSVTAEQNGEGYVFKAGDILRIKVFAKKGCEDVVLEKDFPVEAEATHVDIFLDGNDTKIGEIISKPVDYWYEIELNPHTNPQTIIGYDDDGAKVFKLFPEGGDFEESEPITPEDIPIVDEDLSLTSTRPVQNQAIARAFVGLREHVDNLKGQIKDTSKEVANELLENCVLYATLEYDEETKALNLQLKSAEEIYSKEETDAILDDYITQIATLIGGDA